MQDYKEQFELFDIKVRRLHNGNKLRLNFEIPYNHEIEKEIIDLRGENIKLKLTDINEHVIIDDIVFEVFDIKVRKLAANNKLSFVLENMYDKETEKKIVDCRFDDVILYMTIIDQTLFDQVDEIEDIESPE